MSNYTFLQRISTFGNRIAIKDKFGKYTYQQLFNNSMNIAQKILNYKQSNGKQRRILFLTQPNFLYPSVQFAIWATGGVSIPLSIKATQSEIEYFYRDSEADLIITQNEFVERFSHINANIMTIEKQTQNLNFLNYAINKPKDDALIIYTSGTTGNPKGVVHTHQSIKKQIESLSDAWEWSPDDKILNVLPLHHIHGIMNVLNCALWNSASCEMWEKFDAQKVWKAFLRNDDDIEKLTLFMAVPTIYYDLLKFIEKNEIPEEFNRNEIKKKVQRFRVMISGSAALPEPVMQKWESITGQVLLERFGMTEIGMGISNPLKMKRISGHVGYPLPGVEVAIQDFETKQIYQNVINQEGELLIKSPTLFNRYLNKPNETKDSFTSDGWFKTGDFAQYCSNGMYQILGRLSQDIIKKSGFKISALEIESKLLEHQNVAEVVVFGVPDEKFGEEIAALLVLKKKEPGLDDIKKFCIIHLSSYKVPRKWKLMDEIPRNAMGKVQKKELKKLFI